MRSIVLAASLTLAGASAAQSQQVQSLSTDEFVPKEVAVATAVQAPSLKPVDAPIGMTRAKAGVNALQSNALAASAADLNPDTRNMLAIIGAIVVVVALVAFLL